MIDISVKDLVKSFDSERNVLDGISFDVQEGERVGLLGKNGAGKTTLFKILTGELDYNSGEIAFASGKKVGLISQIPVYPAGYTVDDVLRTAFAQLDRIRVQMQAIEAQMSDHTPQELLSRYDELMNRFTAGGGYEADMLNVPVICLSQLNRAAVGRSDKRPMLNDLRDSGAIEQDADVVIGLHREGYYDQESSDPYLAEAIVLKNRKGQTGTVYLQWLPEFTSFGNRSAKTDDDY